MYYNTCPYCGATLDPGERCDCKEKEMPAGAATQNGKYQGQYQAKTVHHKDGGNVKYDVT